MACVMLLTGCLLKLIEEVDSPALTPAAAVPLVFDWLSGNQRLI